MKYLLESCTLISSSSTVTAVPNQSPGFLFLICLNYVLRMSIDLMKENGLTLEKARKRYPARTITDADYADDRALLAITPAQAESLLHRLERAAGGIGLHVNANQTKYMRFNQNGDIFTLNGGSLKLGNKFTSLGSSDSSTENCINTRLAKAWTAIDSLLVIWKSDLSDKTKRNFFQAAFVSILLYGCTTIEKKCSRQLHKDATNYIIQIPEATSHKTAALRPPTCHLEYHPN